MAKQRESRISKQIVDYLQSTGWKAWKNAGSQFQEAGRPDVMAVRRFTASFDNCKTSWTLFLCIETKVAPSAKPTPLQQRWLDDAAAHGAVAFCAHSVEEVKAELGKRGLG